MEFITLAQKAGYKFDTVYNYLEEQISERRRRKKN